MTTTNPTNRIHRQVSGYEVLRRHLSDHIGCNRVGGHRCKVCKEVCGAAEVVLSQKVVYRFIVTVRQFELALVRIVLGYLYTQIAV